MKFVKALSVGIGSVVLVGLGLTFLAPKAMQAVTATLVQVVNTAANPAIVSSMNDPGRIAYQSMNLNPIYYQGNQAAGFEFGPIPTNHRLVVQHVGFGLMYGSAPSQVTIAYYLLDGYPLGGIASAPVSGVNGVQFDAPAQFYVDQGNRFFVNVFLGAPGQFNTSATQAVTVVGYLLDCAAAPCSAIAQ